MIGFRAKAARFSVLLSPGGGYGLEYRVTRAGLSIVQHIVLPGPLANPVAAANQLWQELGPRLRGADLMIVLRGYGVMHEVMTLPPGDAAPVRAVAARELARLHGPGLHADVLRPAQPPAQPSQQVVAAAPMDMLHTLEQALHERGAAHIRVTTVPRALERLVLELDDATGPCAIVLPLPDGPAIAYLHEGRLRYFIEPLAMSGEVPLDTTLLVEQVARGRLYVRQHFRGASVDRVLVGGGAQEHALLEALQTQLGVQSKPIGAEIGDPGALAAFGGILDRLADDGVDLFAATRRAPTGAERFLPLARVAAIAALVISGAWAAAGGLRVGSESAGLERAREDVAARMPGIWATRSTLEQRAAYDARLAAVQDADARHGQLARSIAALGSAVDGGIRLTSFDAAWGGNAWRIGLGGVASGRSSAEAVGTLNAFYNRIPQRLPVTNLTLGGYDYLASDSLTRTVRLSFQLQLTAFEGTP